jgi:2-oxoglutarate dehydrogenase E2 component (dihydrolipoamide succinyltransferase)
MTAVMGLRATYKDAFEKKHGVKMGFMGFFTKAVVAALKELPNVNAEIEGDNIIYKNYYDIGIAVLDRARAGGAGGEGRRSSVPGRNRKGHRPISGMRARDNKLKLEELQGGTFSITNGGVFGSLMSDPDPELAPVRHLGMHKIQPRPMAIGDKIEIRPMMYLALSYDHRIVDGREAVTFLVKVKENLEDPQRLLLEV